MGGSDNAFYNCVKPRKWAFKIGRGVQRELKTTS